MEPMLYAKGISWIDDCRIGSQTRTNSKKDQSKDGEWGMKSLTTDIKNYGRFPANILVCDDMLNDGVISKSVRGNNRKVKIVGSFGGGTTNDNNEYNDKGTNSRYYDIDKWFNNLLEL